MVMGHSGCGVWSRWPVAGWGGQCGSRRAGTTLPFAIATIPASTYFVTTVISSN
jgi:hypothetical protein